MSGARLLALCIACAFWGAALPIGWQVYQSWPPPNPITIGAHKAEWVDQNTWRVEVPVSITSSCQIIVSRQFAGPGGELVTLQPVDSYLGLAVGSLPYLIRTRIGSRSVWYEYHIKPGRFQEYIIDVSIVQCDNGFKDRVKPAIVPVGLP